MYERLETPAATREWLHQSIDAYQFSQFLYAAAKLGVADLLQDGPRPYEALAHATGTDPAALLRLLRALASAGIFKHLPGDRFEQNDVSALLCESAPGSLRAWAILAGEQPYPAWGHLLHSIKTGEAAADHLYGTNGWQYRRQNPAVAEVFNNAMSAMARGAVAAILESYDFSRSNCIVDVGGGQGSLLAGILHANPSARGVLQDLDLAVQEARDVLARAGVADRCQTVAGSFLQEVPPGGDLYLLKDILLMWKDDDASLVLRNCRQTMQPGQTLLIVERLIPAEGPTLEDGMADLRMLVMNGGRLRSQEDFQRLLSRAGFGPARSIQTRSSYQILEAKAG